MPEPTQVKIKRNLRFVPLLIALLIGVELLWSQSVWMMLVVALGSIWLFEFLWARSLRRGLRFRRELRYGWAQVGDQLEERFTLANQGSLPALWVQVADHSNLAEYDAGIATGVGAASENVWRSKHLCSRRGAFHLGPTTVSTGTPFGMYTLEFQDAASDSLIVMPPVVSLPEITVAPGGKAYEGKRRVSAFERTVSAVGVREYVPGDPLKTIHWRSVAHLDEWMVRTFESTPAGDWWIWLDLDQNTQAGSGENSTLEHAVILAASLAERGLRAGTRGGVDCECQRAHLARAPVGRISAAEHPAHSGDCRSGGTTPWRAARNASPAVDRNASVIVITAAVEGAWVNPLLSFQSRASKPTVLLLDRAS